MTQQHATQAGPQSLPQLNGLRARLCRELSSALSAQPLSAALIERLVQEIAATERQIDALQVVPA